jgi:hypothetical protein
MLILASECKGALAATMLGVQMAHLDLEEAREKPFFTCYLDQLLAVVAQLWAFHSFN